MKVQQSSLCEGRIYKEDLLGLKEGSLTRTTLCEGPAVFLVRGPNLQGRLARVAAGFADKDYLVWRYSSLPSTRAKIYKDDCKSSIQVGFLVLVGSFFDRPCKSLIGP